MRHRERIEIEIFCTGKAIKDLIFASCKKLHEAYFPGGYANMLNVLKLCSIEQIILKLK
jgi:hypothetical protein